MARGPSRTWLAEVQYGLLTELSGGWTSEALFNALLERDERIVVGLDFAFGFPAWYVRQRFGGSPEAAWEAGEDLLAEAPFWGRPGRRRPDLGEDHPHLRATEAAVTSGRPKSIFQTGGAGSVGTGSIRGMPLLARLKSAGFAIWPFDPPRLPLVVEIYPRALTGPVVKSDPVARRRYLELLGWPGDEAQLKLAAAGDDGFDAAVSALRMWQHRSDFSRLPKATPLDVLEGRIWVPPA